MQARLPTRSIPSALHSRHAPPILQVRSRPKEPSRHKHPLATSKKQPNRKQASRKEEPSWGDLFQSARMPPSGHRGITKREKAVLVSSSNNNKFEQSTASRQFKLKSKQYDNPNGEYFGSKISIRDRRKAASKKKDKDQGVLSLTKSLELKIRSLRRMESLHSSESQSIKSDLSEKEMRRLAKMHSVERIHLMEGIVGIGEKLVRKKKRT